MGRRCGCAGTCTCAFVEGEGIAITGEGSKRRPVIIEIDGAHPKVIGGVSGSVLVTVTGAGSAVDPFRVRMDRLGDAQMQPIVTRFTTPGSYVWTKPAFGTLALVEMAGGGGGGAAGYPLEESASRAAQGGTGGQFDLIPLEFLLADLPAQVPLTVGRGGQGGQGAPPSLPPGNGAPGTATSFNGLVRDGGAGGYVRAATWVEGRVGGVRSGGVGGSPMVETSGGGVAPSRTGTPGGPAYGWDYATRQSTGFESGLMLSPGGGGGAGGAAWRRWHLIGSNGWTVVTQYAGNGYAGGPGGGGGGGGNGPNGDPGDPSPSGGRGGDGYVQIVIQ